MKALILSCGGSPEPLKYCINRFQPDFIYFLCSENSIDVALDITEELEIKQDQFAIKNVLNYESLDESFAKSREIIKELQKNYDDIQIDFTGGTKPMVSGLVLAAVGEECSYTYVGSINEESRDKNGMGIVKNGFEKIKSQKDPYDVYAVMEFEKGMDFFDKYQFSASKTNFALASEKLESPDLRELAAFYVSIVEIYSKWDKFENLLYKSKPLNSALRDIIYKINSSTNIKKYLTENFPNFILQIENNLEFLNLKIYRKGTMKIDKVKYYLPDLLNNASRRIEEGKYDDAVARLYRAIELIAQIKLAEEKLIDKNSLDNKKFKINMLQLNERFDFDIDEKICQMPEYREAADNNKKNFGIPLKKSYEILECLNSDFASKYLNDKDIKNNLNSRNGSILAHGLNAIDKTTALNLYNQVFSYAKQAFGDIEKYMEMSKFPKFSDKNEI